MQRNIAFGIIDLLGGGGIVRPSDIGIRAQRLYLARLSFGGPHGSN